MSHCSCGCGHAAKPTSITMPAGVPRVATTQTVDAIGRRSPRALDALKALGINHCCGGHMTLAEAAAAAGVPLDTLVARLEAALAGEPAA